MRNDPGYPAWRPAPRAGEDGAPETTARLGERRSYAAPYEALTFTVLTRARRELAVTLAAQPVFDLIRSAPIARRIRRRVRHRGGESALVGLGQRTLEPADLAAIDLETLKKGMELLRLGPEDSGVLPAFWRTVAAGDGRFDQLCEDIQKDASPGALLIEVLGALEQAPARAIEDVVRHFETGALGAILHIAPDPAAALRLSQAGARCLAIDFAGVAHESAREWHGAAQLIGAARQACAQVLLINLRPDRGLAAQAAGATHAVFADMDPVIV